MNNNKNQEAQEEWNKKNGASGEQTFEQVGHILPPDAITTFSFFRGTRKGASLIVKHMQTCILKMPF